MKTYYDKYSRLHHKPCVNGEPSSNNGWLYTAYAQKLGLPIDKQKLWNCYQACFVNGPVPHVTRSPGKALPPMSRDEILGLVALGVPTRPKKVIWNFSPFAIPKFNLIKLVKQLIEVRGKHRNYFWENNLDQLYRFAYSIPLTDRHFILQKFGRFNLFYYIIAKVDSFLPIKSGIRWLKYGKSLEAMQSEFPEDHPLRGNNA